MAPPPERRGGLLRTFLAAALLSYAASPAGAAGGGLVEAAMRQAARRAGVALDPGRVRVSLRGDVTVEAMSLEFSGGRLEIPRASGKVDLAGLLKRRLKVEGLRLDRPRLLLRGVKPAAGGAKEEGKWTLSLPALEAAGGVVEIEGGPEMLPRRWDLSLLRARYDQAVLEVFSATLVVEGSTASLRGRARLEPALEAEADLSARVPWTGQARLAGQTGDRRISGQATGEGALWNFSGAVSGGPGEVGGVVLVGPEARKVSARRARLGILAGRLKARGRGFSEEALEAEGSWEVSSSTGLALTGTGKAAKGKIHWNAALAGENLAASGSGFFSRNSDDIELSWTLEADRGSLRPLTGFAHGRVTGQGRVRGAAPSARVEAAVQAAEVSFLEGFVFDRFSLAAEGSLKSHDVSWAAESGPSTAAASGRGAWENGLWKADWEELTLDGPFSAKAGPFRTQASPELLTIRGLVLTGDQGLRLRLDGDRKGGKLESLLVEAEGADMAALGAAFGHPFPVAGALSLRGQAAEGPEGLAGDFTLESAGAAIYGMGPGPLSATGRLAGGRALLEGLEWRVGESTLTAAGWAALPREEDELGDFSVKISAPKPGLTADFPTGPFLAQGLGFSCDMTLSRSSGLFSGDGRAEVWAKTLAVPGAGWAATEVDVQLAGRGERVEVVAAKAVTGGRPLKVTGGLGAKGPGLRMEAENLILIPQPGLNAEARVDLELGGSWAVPALRGNIFLTRLDYVPRRPNRRWWPFYKEIIPEVSEELPSPALSPPRAPCLLTTDLKIHPTKTSGTNGDRPPWSSKETSGSRRRPGSRRRSSAPLRPSGAAPPTWDGSSGWSRDGSNSPGKTLPIPAWRPPPSGWMTGARPR